MGGAYGNLPALQACVNDALDQGCDGLFFLGDAIGFAGDSDATIDYIFEKFAVFIAGNLETQAAQGADSCACNYSSAEDEITGCRSFQWSMRSLGIENAKRLAILPETALIATPIGPLLLCHGSPDRQNEFLYESQLEPERLKNWLRQYQVTGLICTHTGLPWIKLLTEQQFAVNCGVTGKPDNDSDPSVHYLLADCSSSVADLQIRSVSYDHNEFADKLRREGVEEIFITPLQTGKWTCGVNSLPSTERAQC